MKEEGERASPYIRERVITATAPWHTAAHEKFDPEISPIKTPTPTAKINDRNDINMVDGSNAYKHKGTSPITEKGAGDKTYEECKKSG